MKYILILLLLFSFSDANRFEDDLKEVETKSVKSKSMEKFLSEVKVLIEAHNWKSYIKKCQPSHYKTQVKDLGMGVPQYIVESFGISKANNYKIHTIANEKPSFANLNRISKITIGTPKQNDYFINVAIKIFVDGADMVLGELSIIYTNGEYWISGAVG